MPHVTGFRCIRCAKQTPLPKGREAVYTCACGGNLEVTYDFAAARRELTRERLAADGERSIFRYFPLLPVESRRHAERLGIGGTPLLAAPALGAQLGLERLWLKDDTRLPSASFKDRAGAVALAVAIERGEERVSGASTGNAASSLACLAARTGVKTTIFVPHTAPPAKVAQILLFGATVVQVKGTYDQAFDLCLEACREYGWYNRNTGFNPFTREGKKTCAFEVLEQLQWQVPDWVVVPVGDGNIISGIYKGFVEAREVGLVDKVPRLLAAQAAGSNAVTLAVNGDGVIRPVSGATLADSISVSLPRDGEAAVKAVRESGGAAVAVSDDEILAAMRALASHRGRVRRAGRGLRGGQPEAGGEVGPHRPRRDGGGAGHRQWVEGRGERDEGRARAALVRADARRAEEALLSRDTMKLNETVLDRAAKLCREKNVVIPTLAQMRDPSKVPDAVKKRLPKVGLWDVDPVNLFRISWKNDVKTGLFGGVNAFEVPKALTGTDARVIGLVGKYFPTGAHKVGAAFGCLVPRLVTGGFDPTTQKAVWPSTGNYCRGGAFDCALLGATAVAILPEGMSRERFEWLKKIGAEVIATPGTESNVKEIYDKCWEIRRTRPNDIIFNQFEELG